MSVEIEALLDEGYDKAEIERDLGVRLCKRDGCFELAVAMGGSLGGLCAAHREEKRQEISAKARDHELERRRLLRESTVPVHEYEAQRDSVLEHPVVEESRNGAESDSDVNQDDDAPEFSPQLEARRARRAENLPHYASPSPYSGPAEPDVPDFRTDAGKRASIFDGFAEPERDRWVRLLSQLERDDERLDVEIEEMGGSAKPAKKTGDLVMSRGAKVRRIAEALARLSDRKWWDMKLDEKRRYVRLADRAMTAMELVEHEASRLARGEGARLDREALERMPS